MDKLNHFKDIITRLCKLYLLEYYIEYFGENNVDLQIVWNYPSLSDSYLEDLIDNAGEYIKKLKEARGDYKETINILNEINNDILIDEENYHIIENIRIIIYKDQILLKEPVNNLEEILYDTYIVLSMKDFYNNTIINSDVFVGLELFRTTFTDLQFMSTYIHPHISMMDKVSFNHSGEYYNNYINVNVLSPESFCVGTNVILKNALKDLTNIEKRSYMDFMMNMSIIMQSISIESKDGGPYINTSSIKYLEKSIRNKQQIVESKAIFDEYCLTQHKTLYGGNFKNGTSIDNEFHTMNLSHIVSAIEEDFFNHLYEQNPNYSHKDIINLNTEKTWKEWSKLFITRYLSKDNPTNYTGNETIKYKSLERLYLDTYIYDKDYLQRVYTSNTKENALNNYNRIVSIAELLEGINPVRTTDYAVTHFKGKQLKFKLIKTIDLNTEDKSSLDNIYLIKTSIFKNLLLKFRLFLYKKYLINHNINNHNINSEFHARKITPKDSKLISIKRLLY